MQVLNDVLKVASVVFDRDNLDPEDSMDTVSSWTSLKNMEFILSLEQHFKLKASSEDLAKMYGFRGVDAEGHPTGWANGYTLTFREIADIISKYTQ